MFNFIFFSRDNIMYFLARTQTKTSFSLQTARGLLRFGQVSSSSIIQKISNLSTTKDCLTPGNRHPFTQSQLSYPRGRVVGEKVDYFYSIHLVTARVSCFQDELLDSLCECEHVCLCALIVQEFNLLQRLFALQIAKGTLLRWLKWNMQKWKLFSMEGWNSSKVNLEARRFNNKLACKKLL